MSKIVFFEDANYQGRSYECDADSLDLSSHLRRCNSIKVERGCWVLFQHPNYEGYQYVLSPGEYPDHHKWMGFNDSVKSCRSVKNVYGKSWKIRFYDEQDFAGQAAECGVDCPSIYEALQFGEVRSCVVMDGAWVLYERPNYHGHQYFLERGEYPSYTDWGAASPAVGSLRMITDF
ncbi:gamma-crystallin M2-like [Dunckerocampus dactyliophorus]|uniref:gamma-crystallin M2-like n=1 Tax=Dunckerocampus dactyliophorus TaxID=161453 RepID=UPI0024062A4F|nr:gamma-crystallin M2-like [Dunckerocampus dactyliophorus]